MYDRSSIEDQECLQAFLKNHFEAALRKAGLVDVVVTTQHSQTMAEGFDVLFDPPIEFATMAALSGELVKKMKLNERDYGHYINDAEQKNDGMMVRGTAKSLLRRLDA